MYKFNDDFCYQDQIGQDGIDRDSLPIYESKVKEIFSIYSKQNSNTKFYKILFAKEQTELLNSLAPIAKNIRENFDDVVIVAMGGAILNPRTVLSLRKNNKSPRFHFLYTTDPVKFSTIIDTIDCKKTAILVISKSGETTETISGFSAFYKAFEDRGIPDLAKRFFFIVGESDNPIRKMASATGATIVNHDDGYGGRFTVFSAVGLLPGLIAGLDMQKFIAGANSVTEDLWQNRIDSQPIRAALSLILSRKPITACVGYLDAFSPLLEWYAQIISESLAKEGQGITPVWGIGPMDQHSVLQLYLDGPKDKLYNMMCIEKLGHNISLHNNVIPSYLASKSLEEIHMAEFNATVTSLKNNNLHTRVISMDEFNEFNMGAVMMHFAIEIITAGHMMNVNPFDQPGVEQIKVEARKILSK